MTLNVTVILKEGHRMKFLGEYVLVHGSPYMYLIPFDTIKPGDIIPRDSDLPMKWDI